jgi:hypothetical protein
MSVADRSRGKVRARSVDGRLSIDGRAVVLGCVALYLSLVAGLRALWQVDIWPWLGVPSGPSVFFDARNVAAAVECSRLGHDPLVDNPCDPWGRAMFYPRAWLVLRWTGLDQTDTLLFGIVIVAMFVLAFLLLLPRLSLVEGLIAAAAVCSPAVMFAVERANMDLVIFSGLALAAIMWRRGGAIAQYAAIGLVLLMAVAKLYPALALLAFLPVRRRGAAAAAAAALLVFSAYIVVTRDDIAAISSTVTQGQYYSYGARILLGRLYHGLVGDEWEGSRALAQGLVLVAVTLIAAGLLLSLRHRSRGARPPADGPTIALALETPELIAFRMGALIYIGTFVTGNSFDYRMVFLLLVLPLLLRWPDPHRAADKLASLPRATLAMVMLALWIGTLSEHLRLWDELVSWALAGMLLMLLARSAPPLTAVLRPARAGERPRTALDESVGGPG